MATKWAELPLDLLAMIARRVKVIEDFIAFSPVCTSWRSVATKHNFDALYPQVPLLMLAEKDDDYREFYSLTKKNTTRIYLPEARGRECHPSQGWICTVSYAGEMNLLHPFSRTQVQLPPEKALWALHGYEQDPQPELWQFLEKAVLSASPCVTSDYVLVITCFAGENLLAFWRPGDLNWTKIDVGRVGVPALNYYKGKFYCVTWSGQVWVFDIPGSSIAQPVVQPRKLVELKDNLFLTASVNYYLVEVSGALLFIARFSHGNGGQTFNFKVYELDDVIKGELKEINTLGDSAVFLGDGAMSIESSKYKGVKPNYIYFCDDWCEVKQDDDGGGRDMGAYNLEDGKFESFYPGLSLSFLSPPTWVTPSF